VVPPDLDAGGVLGQPAMEYSDELTRVISLCESLGIRPADALRELRTLLQDRRDFLAIPHPVWRQTHIDECLAGMRAMYGPGVEAREKFDAMQDLWNRGGARIEDRGAQHAWKEAEFLRSPTQRCPYCRVSVDSGNAEVDHRIPIGRGGRDDPSNWQLACPECNRGKSDALEDSFSLAWGGGELYRQLVLEGKDTVSLAERFAVLARDGFACRAGARECEGRHLAVYFMRPPGEGGQALPENLVCLCDAHGTLLEAMPIRGRAHPT
jgi:hypothetical protein